MLALEPFRRSASGRNKLPTYLPIFTVIPGHLYGKEILRRNYKISHNLFYMSSGLHTESQLFSMWKLHMHTFSDSLPMPTVLPDTAEHDGRYSEGSHTRFSELYVIHAPSELNPPP
jgi:hypothetical protein